MEFLTIKEGLTSTLIQENSGPPTNSTETIPFLTLLSQFCGIAYTIAWTFGAYPQIYRIWKNKNVHGLSLDFIYYGLLGFIYSSCFVLFQYFQQYVDEAAEAVKPIDLIYTLHAMILISIICIQFYIYRRGPIKFGSSFKFIVGCILVLTFIIFILAATSKIPWMITITKLNNYVGKLNIFEQFIYSFSFIQFLGYVNSLLTVVKYVPQVHLNFIRKRTSGLSIWIVVSDFIGGIMSFSQNAINSINYHDLEYLTGNLPKLAVAITSLAFDVIILVQFWCYRVNNQIPEEVGEEDTPLI